MESDLSAFVTLDFVHATRFTYSSLLIMNDVPFINSIFRARSLHSVLYTLYNNVRCLGLRSMGNFEEAWRISGRGSSCALSQDWHTVHKLGFSWPPNESISRQSVRGLKSLRQQKSCDYGEVNTATGECGAVPPVPEYTTNDDR